MRNKRENFLISGALLLVLGAMLSFGADAMMGAIMGISGILCFILGMSTGSTMEMSPEAVANWQPSMESLPDAGRYMYRVDVTMDQPIKSSILCGPCGHLEHLDGGRPSQYSCTKCGKELWLDEEE